jgi:hypothetical protein
MCAFHGFVCGIKEKAKEINVNFPYDPCFYRTHK